MSKLITKPDFKQARNELNTGWSEEFKEWASYWFHKGHTAQSICNAAHRYFPVQCRTLTRNATVGLVHRYSGKKTRVLVPGERGVWMGVVTIPGPAWALPDLPYVEGVAA